MRTSVGRSGDCCGCAMFGADSPIESAQGTQTARQRLDRDAQGRVGAIVGRLGVTTPFALAALGIDIGFGLGHQLKGHR